ncbi:hypothetical protein H5410_057101 [Solanum commersonii]|uniref:Polyprotein protein n=1 Tax=Solanum commersonii TaxID=4109 RepID=A0A9J5WP56_SOLCO|nr:hypothetical protein H5410_057101 [Solanum commersonii]
MIEGHKLVLDALTVRVEECEKIQGATVVMKTLKANVVGLRRDVDELRSINFSMLFGTVEIPEMPSADVPASSEVPPATTEDEIKVDDVNVKAEAEIDEEQLGASLRDTSKMGSSGTKDADEPGTDALTEGVTDMQISPKA